MGSEQEKEQENQKMILDKADIEDIKHYDFVFGWLIPTTRGIAIVMIVTFIYSLVTSQNTLNINADKLLPIGLAILFINWVYGSYKGYQLQKRMNKIVNRMMHDAESDE